MKVESIRSRMLFGNFYPQAGGQPEGLKFFVSATVALWGPPLFFCYVIGDVSPLYVIFCTQALGLLSGVLMYLRRPGPVAVCVPVDKFLDTASGTREKVCRKVA